jgi:hypothetical protein
LAAVLRFRNARFPKPSLIAALATGLRERGVPDHVAMLAAQMGMAALGHAVACWFDDGSSDLGGHLVQAFHKMRDLSASSSGIG